MPNMTEIAEKSIELGRKHRDDMALWLALEVLMTSSAVEAEDDLYDRLSLFQDKLEARMRAAVGLNERD